MRYKALKAAFPYTLPIFTGFWFLGMAYGIYANASGFSFLYPMFMSLLIYGGSLEFVTVEMLLSPFAPVQVLIMALLIQARHLFYGLSMLDKFKGLGWKKYYLIFGMCDETFSINCSVDIPEGVDSGWFMFFVTLLNQLYWAGSATLGALAGSLLHINTEGISFVMTAMFVVIFLEQWMKETNHTASILGLLISVICLICFGADAFLIPTMILIVVLLALLKPRLDQERTGGFTMTLTQQIITIAMCVLGTMATRFLPFIIFNEKRRTPEFVQYLGKFLPSAIFGMLVIYCLKNVSLFHGTHGLPGRNRYLRHRRASLLETQHADIHRRRHDMLLAPASFCLCINSFTSEH